jgi:hypothetical protein
MQSEPAATHTHTHIAAAAAAAAGEDIFMSLVSYKLTCAMPRILPGGWPEKTAAAMKYLEDKTDVSAWHCCCCCCCCRTDQIPAAWLDIAATAVCNITSTLR